ncbi:MAG: hypothetical protein ACHQK8_08170, partial [Bacteroidia bacterium]
MKKLNTLSILSSFAICSLISSCSSSSTPDATPTPAPNNATVSISVTTGGKPVTKSPDGNNYVFIDDSVIITVTCSGNSANTLQRVKLTASYASPSTVIDTTVSGTSDFKVTGWIAQNIGTNVSLTATVTGSSGSPGTAAYSFVVTDIGGDAPLLGNQSYAETNKRLWALYNSQTKAYGISYSLNEVLQTIAKPDYIDLMFCSRTDKNALNYGLMMSPSSVSAENTYGVAGKWSPQGESITYWSTRNKTTLYPTQIKAGDFITIQQYPSKSMQSAAIDDAISKYTSGADTAVLTSTTPFIPIWLF